MIKQHETRTNPQANQPDVLEDFESIIDAYWRTGAGALTLNQPADILRMLGAAEVLEPCVSGTGSAFRNKLALVAALAKRSAGLATAVLAHLNNPLWLLAGDGTSALWRDYRSMSVRGVAVSSTALAEPGARVDPLAHTAPQVRFEGDQLVLDGLSGPLVLNAPHADFVLVLARSQEQTELTGLTWVLVPLPSPGVTVTATPMAALKPASFGAIKFDKCRLSGAHALGQRHGGMLQLAPAVIEEQLTGAALVLEVAKKALDDCIGFVRTRAFEGGTLADTQIVRHRIAEFHADYVIAKCYVDEIAGLHSMDLPLAPGQAAGTALIAGQAAQRIVDGCAQLYGGRGFLRDFSIAIARLDILAARFSGTSPEVARAMVSRDLSAHQHPMFSNQHHAFRAHMRAVVDEHIAPHLEVFEREGVSRELFQTMGKAGVFKALAPVEFGGMGLDFLHSIIIAEEFMRHRAVGVGSSLMLQANTLCPILSRYGGASIRAEFLTPLMEGRAVGSLAVTEPSGGSALMTSVGCEAVLDGDDWVVNGEKMFITNGPIADVVVVLARTESKPGPFSMSLIAVPSSTEGFSVLSKLDKLGLNASPVGWLKFSNCRVPKNNLVGMRGKGYLEVSDTMKEERLLIAIGSIALAESCLSATMEDLKSAQHGEPSEGVWQELSQFRAELDAARVFAYATAGDVVAGNVSMVATSVAKFGICELVQKIVQRLVELRGSAGLIEGSWTERAYRDSRVLSVYAGTSDTMRELVGRRLLPEALRKVA